MRHFLIVCHHEHCFRCDDQFLLRQICLMHKKKEFNINTNIATLLFWFCIQALLMDYFHCFIELILDINWKVVCWYLYVDKDCWKKFPFFSERTHILSLLFIDVMYCLGNVVELSFEIHIVSCSATKVMLIFCNLFILVAVKLSFGTKCVCFTYIQSP